MGLLRNLAVSLIPFGFGIIVGYLIQGYPEIEAIKSSILSIVLLGVSLGAGAVLLDKILVTYLDARKERREYLQNHSRDLVEDVLKKWFETTFSVRLREADSNIIARTPLANLHYNSHFKSEIVESIELYDLKYSGQAKEHLKEYSDIWNIWLECEKLSKAYLDKNIKICEGIEEKVVASFSSKFAECDTSLSKPTCYILDETVKAIYQEANRFMMRGEFYGHFRKNPPEQGNIKVGMGQLYAKSPDEILVDEFIKIAYEIATDKNLLEQLKLLDAQEKIIDENVEKFKHGLDKIIDDFERGHINLKGICWRVVSLGYDRYDH